MDGWMWETKKYTKFQLKTPTEETTLRCKL